MRRDPATRAGAAGPETTSADDKITTRVAGVHDRPARTRRRITIEEAGEIIVVRGFGARDLAREAGLKPIFSGSVGGWMLDRSRLPDLLASLQHRGIAVEVGERS